MLLDLRVMFSAGIAAVLLLIGGFGLLATLRTHGNPAVAISAAPAEITGSIAARGDKLQALTDTDRAARPASSAAPAAPPALLSPEPIRAVNVEKTETAEAPKTAEEDKPAPPRRAAARPRVNPARQEMGANFRANNPFAFPFFGVPANTGQ